MKFQCACGVKYALDVVPGMPPVQFVCSACGQDYSAFVNDLIRQQLGQPAAAPQPTAPAPEAPSAPAAPAPPKGSGLKISRGHAPEAPKEEAPASKYCPKHRTEFATGQCQVCHQPTCPKCQENFGPFCSAFCRNKVEGPSMVAQVHIGQRFEAQNAFWRKAGLIFKIVGGILVILLGFWFWYAWIGSAPKQYFSVRWDGISHSGTSWIVNGDQLVFLHGGTLARYNLQTKQKVWSIDLVTQQQIDQVIKEEDKESADEVRRTGSASDEAVRPAVLRQKSARIDLEEQYSLHGAGKNVWLANGNTLTHYDWDSGNLLQNITVTNGTEELTDHGDEFLVLGRADDGSQSVTHISIDDGQMRTEEFSGTPAVAAQMTTRRVASDGGGGLPISRNGSDRPLDPQRVAQQAQNMGLAGRLALPALVANSEHNRQISSEINQEDGKAQYEKAQAAEDKPTLKVHNFDLIPDGDSYIGFGSELIKENIVEREAMKAPPKTSALNDSNLSTANEQAAVNEQLNEIQRNNGGDKVTEDQSEYQVAVRRPASSEPDWFGTVIGSPEFFPLKTVNVIAAGKTIIVLDKSNKQLWQAQLTYDVTGGEPHSTGGQGLAQESPFGKGPCVENNGTLYVFDQAVLAAYDPATGNARWRIPSVGVVGLFFDDSGMLYVNTTSGNPDDIKYSRQIDISKQTEAIVMKVDPSNGNILWKTTPGGYISYLDGKFIYAYESFDPGDDDEQMNDVMQSLEKPALLRIIRISPSNGHVMWQHDEGRAPVDVQFDHNMISVVLKKEVEVLRFFTF